VPGDCDCNLHSVKAPAPGHNPYEGFAHTPPRVTSDPRHLNITFMVLPLFVCTVIKQSVPPIKLLY